MKKIAIVGFGRFGKTLYRLIKDDFFVIIVEKENPQKILEADVVFYCVPISKFEKTIKEHKKYFKPNHLLIDVLSVKLYPEKIFKKYLKGLKTQAILTHPMFGPDSSKNGFQGLNFMMTNFNADIENYNFWKKYFSSKGLNVVEITAKQHDYLAASSQGLTHFIGRVLEAYGFKPTSIDTLGAKKLYEVVNQTCNDNIRLFRDLQIFNPYTKKMRIKLGRAYEKIYKSLLPSRVNKKYFVIGIQGGYGSFNEQAAIYIMEKRKIKKYKIKYLYTADKVLKNLSEGNIDYGIFAVYNNTGGIVRECIYSMARYKFKIIDEFSIKIRHFLMKRRDVDFKYIDKIIAHPQVFKQCKKTLQIKYPHLKQISGKGNMIDTAKSAEALSKGKIDKKTAILGSSKLAEIYNFDIIDKDLQDDKENNYTTFFLVVR